MTMLREHFQRGLKPRSFKTFLWIKRPKERITDATSTRHLRHLQYFRRNNRLPPLRKRCAQNCRQFHRTRRGQARLDSSGQRDRKSTRLNSSHRTISYAVFCLKKKKK